MLIHSSLLELYEISIFAGPKWLNICTFTWLNSKCTQNVQCFYVSSHLTLTALRGSRHSSEENEARRGKTHCQHLLPLLPTCLRGISQTRASHCQNWRINTPQATLNQQGTGVGGFMFQPPVRGRRDGWRRGRGMCLVLT